MRSVLWCVISSALLAPAASAAQLPDYDGSLELQVRSNIVDGFNLPANSCRSTARRRPSPSRVTFTTKGRVGPEIRCCSRIKSAHRILRCGFSQDVFDRERLLMGVEPRPAQRFVGFPNLLMPADVDGPAPPPGSPALLYTFRDGGESFFVPPSPVDSLDVYEAEGTRKILRPAHRRPE